MLSRLSLRTRLLVGVIALAGVGLVAADVATYSALSSYLVGQVDNTLNQVHVGIESQVFTHALRLASPAERAAYLDAACAGQADLRAAVDALLHAHAEDPGFLEQPAGSLWETVDEPAAPALETLQCRQ